MASSSKCSFLSNIEFKERENKESLSALERLKTKYEVLTPVRRQNSFKCNIEHSSNDIQKTKFSSLPDNKIISSSFDNNINLESKVLNLSKRSKEKLDKKHSKDLLEKEKSKNERNRIEKPMEEYSKEESESSSEEVIWKKTKKTVVSNPKSKLRLF